MSKRLVILVFVAIFLSACGSSEDHPIEDIYGEQHYMETDKEREYTIAFYEDGRADVAWYGMEDNPESLTYEISEEKTAVENEDSMHMISFHNFPSHSYGLSNSNDDSFLVDSTEDGIVLRYYDKTQEGKTYLKKDKNFEEAGYPASDKRDIYLVNSSN